MRRRLWLALVLTALPFANVGADEQVCRDPLADWRVDAGELQRGAQCGTYVGTTDAGTGPFSYARFTRRTAVELPFEVQVTWRSLTHDGPLEVGLVGGIVLLSSEKCGFFFSNESFEWTPLPGHRTRNEHKVLVRQAAKEVTLFVDGVKTMAWPFTAVKKRGEVSVAMKGPRGERARMVFRDVQVRAWNPLTDNPSTPR